MQPAAFLSPRNEQDLERKGRCRPMITATFAALFRIGFALPEQTRRKHTQKPFSLNLCLLSTSGLKAFLHSRKPGQR